MALEMNNKCLTFAQLYKQSVIFARKLASTGIKKGDTVSIFMSNSIELVTIIFALKNLGAITVLHNLRLTTKELSFQLEDAGSQLLLIDHCSENSLRQQVNIPILSNLELANLKEMELCELLEEVNLNDTDTIMYTSGTTGFPKGVKQTYGNHFWSATGSALNMGLHQEDCWLLAVPIFHISGLSILMRSVIYGMKILIHKRFDAATVHQDLMTKEVTIISVVTAMLNGLLAELGSGTYPPSFRCMLVGGGTVPKSILSECKSKNIPVYQTYGMTETCSQIVTLSPDSALLKLGSAGKPLYPNQLKIMKEKQEASSYEIGEIVVKGPNVTPGYFNRTDATLAAIQDGWLYTGDLGYLDEEGFLYVVDRRSDLIISGGENIYPAEIEAAILSHPFIEEAGVTGMMDEKWGQVPIGFFVIKQGKTVEKEQLIEHLHEQLAKYKVPKQFYSVSSLPKNASNKLLRRKLLDFLPKEGDDEHTES